MRRSGTHAEASLWKVLRDRRLNGWKWRRQVPLGPYIADFLCIEARLIVELDREAHDDSAAYDARRTAHLARLGFRVLRFPNARVQADVSGVCADILLACEAAQRTPSPALRAGEGRVRPGSCERPAPDDSAKILGLASGAS